MFGARNELEHQLHPELDLPRIDLGARDFTEVHLGDIGDGSSKDHAVQRVQNFHTELMRHCFADASVLRDRKGLVQARWAANFQVARRAAKLSFPRQREGAPVQVEVFGRVKIGHRDVTPDVAREQIRTEPAVEERQRIRNRRRQPAPTVVSIYQRDLPSAEEFVCNAA